MASSNEKTPVVKVFLSEDGKYEPSEEAIRTINTVGIDLWNYSLWPKSEKDLKEVLWECRLNEVRTKPGGHLIIWMPLRFLHTTSFHPTNISKKGPFEHKGVRYDLRDRWNCTGTIVNASQIGFIYRKPHVCEVVKPNFGCKKFFKEKSVQKSSVIAKHLIERFCENDSLIIDETADSSAHLAIWAKRIGVNYIGYAKNKNDYEEIGRKLAQTELPMIQESLFG